jgi:DNA-binding transcriptional MerR regulator
MVRRAAARKVEDVPARGEPIETTEPLEPVKGLLYWARMTQKWFKAADVCEMAELQPYVLRSWEKEFPGIGVQKSAESPRLYRQSDVEQVLKIKQLVFGEGLTLSGARRRLEESDEPQSGAADEDVAEVLDALASDARTRIASVRDGLRSILKLLSSAPGTVVVVDDYRLEPPAPSLVKGARRSMAARSKSSVASKRVVARKPARPAKRNKRATA